MIGPLIVLVAHGLDLMTLGWALQRYPFSGETNPFATMVYAAGGLGAIVAAKVGGAAILAWIVHPSRQWSPDARRRRWPSRMLLFASAAGIVGAAANLTALAL